MPEPPQLKRPPRVRRGDRIGIVAPARHIFDEAAAARGLRLLESLGFRVETGPNVYSRYGNTTAPAPERAQEILEMFRRPDIKAIICLTGGGGSAELLELLDYDLIAQHPTIFSGQSDVTHLLLALLSRAGVISLHGMELLCGFGASPDLPAFRYNVDLFMRCCTSEGPLGIMPRRTTWECWRPGTATGRLVGGFYGIVAGHALGRYWPSFDKTILFWEAITKDAGQLLARFSVLEKQGFFDNVVGMVVGKLVGPSADEDAQALRADTRKQIVELTESYGFPIIGNADFGHDGSFMPLPEGLLAYIDAAALRLEFRESMVE